MEGGSGSPDKARPGISSCRPSARARRRFRAASAWGGERRGEVRGGTDARDRVTRERGREQGAGEARPSELGPMERR
jgi:hypothetical protein